MTGNEEFLRLLVSRGFLDERAAAGMAEAARTNPSGLVTSLMNAGTVSRTDLGRAWGDSINISFVDLHKVLFQPQIVQLLPENFARANHIILLSQFGEVITAALADPLDKSIIRQAEALVKKRISPVFTFSEDIDEAIDIQYQSTCSIEALSGTIPLEKMVAEGKEIDGNRLKALAGDKAVMELVRDIFLLALKERASDIHFEPAEDTFRIRFRVDGVLNERIRLEKALIPPMVSRMKILADLDITERRKPQDGRIKLPIGERSVDFRFSSVPTIYGEKIVLRILGQLHAREVPDLVELGFSATIFKHVQKVVEAPNGVFIVTGPTGSGKTTTLYAVLKHLNRPGVNIMTIEDPIEYRLKGINQVQVNNDAGLDFAAGLRAFLRQDPDIILVGEIRDLESARIASQAALTGHLVMTTMHTNGAIQSVTRLVDIGVEPFLVAPSIIGVLFQRLVRTICEHCKEPYRLTPEQISDLFEWDGKTPVTFYRGKGCPECNNTGYRGRTGVHEMLILNNTIRRLISRDASLMEIQDEAFRTGFRSIRHDGLKKVLRGITTIDEVERITANPE